MGLPTRQARAQGPAGFIPWNSLNDPLRLVHLCPHFIDVETEAWTVRILPRTHDWEV